MSGTASACWPTTACSAPEPGWAAVHFADRLRSAIANACLSLVDSIVGRRAAVETAPRDAVATHSAAEALKLNLGCGDKRLPGYLNIDVAPSRRGVHPDVVCDLRRLERFADDSAVEVLAVHVIEHFWRWEVEDVLREWLRVLKPGGEMVIECPNLVSACETVLADPAAAGAGDARGQRSMWVFYGDPSWRDPLMCHRWAYTPASLANLMVAIGLAEVRQEPAKFKLREPRDMRLVGRKPDPRAAVAPPPAIAPPRPVPPAAAAPRASGGPAPAAPSAAAEQYHRWYYDSQVWKQVSYHGIRTLKLVSDLWNYQEIVFEHGIDYVVETGTRHGGSALFFADTLAARNEQGFVVSIDLSGDENQVRSHPRIRFLVADSAAPATVRSVTALLPEPAQRGPCFWILDSDHSRDHVLRELEAWVPVMKPGDYLVVEDSNVNGHPVRPDFGPGPWEAIRDFNARHPGLLAADRKRAEKFGLSFATDGYFIRAGTP